MTQWWVQLMVQSANPPQAALCRFGVDFLVYEDYEGRKLTAGVAPVFPPLS